MRRALKILILAAAAALVWAPTPARADSWVAPFAGVDFGSTANTNGRGAYGVDIGGMGAGIIGGEVDFGWIPHFFGDTGTFGGNYELNVHGNVIVGIPIGGTSGAGIRPYATAGVGWTRTSIENINGLASIKNDDPGFNLGVGAMGFFNDRVGLRGDVRYFRDFHNNAGANQFNLDLGGLHFWRATVGVVFR
jgi:hypothetical protein